MKRLLEKLRNINDELIKELEEKYELSLLAVAKHYFFTELNHISRKTILRYIEKEPLLEVSGDIVRCRKAGSPDLHVALSDIDFAFLDTETTMNNFRAVEIGLLFSKGEIETGRYSTLLNPRTMIDPGVLELTGITREEIEKAPHFEDVWPEIEKLLRGKTIVAHNLPFDRGVIVNELQRAQLRFTPDLPCICTLKLARTLLKRGECSLDELSCRFDLKAGGRHRALPDAVLAYKLLFRLIRYAEENFSVEIKELGDFEKFKALLPPSDFRV
jgi:DNA polymerase III epsilon subunit-like protein